MAKATAAPEITARGSLPASIFVGGSDTPLPPAVNLRATHLVVSRPGNRRASTNPSSLMTTRSFSPRLGFALGCLSLFGAFGFAQAAQKPAAKSTAASPAATAAAAAATTTADGSQTLVFTGARLIDGTGKAPVENATIVVKDGRIVSAGTAATSKGPKDAQTIDLKGKTVMPGIISAHSHLGLVKGLATAVPEHYTRENVAKAVAQFEAYGVTAIMSLGANQDTLYGWRDEQRAGKLPGADIFTGDRGLGVPRGVPPFPVPGEQVYRPTNPDEARAAVRESATRKPDMLKLWLDDNFGAMPKMTSDVYQAAIAEAHAAIDEAHKHGLRFAAHVFYLDDAKALLKAGIDVIGHSVRDQPVDEEFISLMKAKKTPYIPTLQLDETQFIFAEHPAWMDDPFFKNAVDPAVLAAWQAPEYATKMAANPNTPKNKAAAAMGQKNVKTLFDNGVFISFGTDSGAFPTRIPGFGEHLELQLLVRAGLKPMDAIVCATSHAAETIGQGAERGTLEAGKRADFIVLGANPLDDIRNSQKIEAVWHGGRQVTPATKMTTAAR